MNKLKKFLYLSFGIIFMILGSIGVGIPVLPTTPFLLLASYCFVKGSDKFNEWFISTKLYKKYLESFIKERAMTMKKKLTILLTADCMLLISIILIKSIHVRIFLVLLIIYKLYYFMFKIRTIEEKVTDEGEVGR